MIRALLIAGALTLASGCWLYPSYDEAMSPEERQMSAFLESGIPDTEIAAELAETETQEAEAKRACSVDPNYCAAYGDLEVHRSFLAKAQRERGGLEAMLPGISASLREQQNAAASAPQIYIVQPRWCYGCY